MVRKYRDPAAPSFKGLTASITTSSSGALAVASKLENGAPHVLSVLLLRCCLGVLLTLVLLLSCCTTLLVFTELAGPSKIALLGLHLLSATVRAIAATNRFTLGADACCHLPLLRHGDHRDLPHIVVDIPIVVKVPKNPLAKPRADVTCFTGDGSSSVSKSARGGHEEELTRKAIVPRLALVAGTLHTCSTTSATATASTASSSPSCSSTLLDLSRSPSIREFVAIAPHVSALVAKMTLAVEPSATVSVVLVVIAVSATPAASIEVVAAKSASPSSSAPSTAIPLADACCPVAIRTRQLTAAEVLLKDHSLHVFKREAGQVTIEVDDERGP
ncbi:unnamed protein product [Closterium sp. NIES-54]